LINAGIDAFKIEGRMRDPLYIDETTACYREAIDAFYDETYTPEKVTQWQLRLSKVFNRGFHTGFYYASPKPQDIQQNARGNQALSHKIWVGKAINYYAKIGVVEIELCTNQIKLGQELIFENKTDLFFRQIIDSLQIDQNPVNETPQASSENHVIVSMRVDQPLPRNADVYIYDTSLENVECSKEEII
jgi:putative protease